MTKYEKGILEDIWDLYAEVVREYINEQEMWTKLRWLGHKIEEMWNQESNPMLSTVSVKDLWKEIVDEKNRNNHTGRDN